MVLQVQVKHFSKSSCWRGADVQFLSVSGSHLLRCLLELELVEFEIYLNKQKSSSCYYFIDEIDAIGKAEPSGPMGGNDEREQTLNQLLAEMDGFSTETAPVIVLAATNRPEVLDPALLRPGRFDRQVLVDKPDYEGRIEILNVHIKDVKISKDVDLKEVAK